MPPTNPTISAHKFYDFGMGAPSAHDLQPRTMTESDLFEMLRVQVGRTWNLKTRQEAMGIVECESTRQTAVESDNPAGGKNIGIFQIWSGNVLHPEYLKSPQYSALVARNMWLVSGWDRWACKGSTPSKLSGPADEAVPELLPGVDDPQLDPLGKLTELVDLLFQADTWFRVGKGALGGVLIILGTGALVFITANKTGVGRAVTRAAL